MIPFFRSDPLAAAADVAALRRGEITPEEYRARAQKRAQAVLPLTRDPAGWLSAIWRNAGKTGENRLTLPEIDTILRTKGGTEDDDHEHHDQG